MPMAARRSGRKYLPKLATGEFDRLLRPDRAGSWLRSWRHGHQGREGFRRLQVERRQDLDLQRAGRRCGGGLGQARQRHPRLYRRARDQRLLHPQDRRQALFTRLDHRRDRAGRLPDPGRQPLAQCERSRRPVRLSQQRPLRHCLGRHGGGRVLLARGAAIHARPQAVRPAARRQSTDPEEARRHADRNRARAAGRAAAWAA